MTGQAIVFEYNGERYEAPVDPMPVKRFMLTDGHLIVRTLAECKDTYRT